MTQQPIREGGHAGPRRSTRRLPWMLTQMEWRVVVAICNGATIRAELAQEFRLNVRTIDHHIGKVYEKTGAVNLAGVVLCVLRHPAARRLCWPELRIEEAA